MSSVLDSCMQIQRKEKRQDITRPLYFQSVPFPGEFAISVNVSNCGLCLITNRFFSPGDKVEIASKHIWDGPKTAVVVWARSIHNRVMQFGLDFCAT